jgi:hypothetical protein
MGLIATRYGFKTPTTEREFEVDLASPLEGRGSNSVISLPIAPDTWYELFQLSNSGTIPTVKYRGGSLYLDLKSMKVRFGEGTRALVGGEELLFVNGEWQKSPASTGQ